MKNLDRELQQLEVKLTDTVAKLMKYRSDLLLELKPTYFHEIVTELKIIADVAVDIEIDIWDLKSEEPI